VADKVVALDGKPAIAKMISINVTFDHRVLDGMHASVMSRVFREWIEKPYEHFDKLDSVTTSVRTPA
jgi:pyruvate dehydrogenase E2 component (dihydrolipoamide acetyltransferase)